MNKHFLILIPFFLSNLFIFSQSVVGVSGGYYDPLSYRVKLDRNSKYPYFVNADVGDRNGYYLSEHFKNRVNEHFNIGVILTYKKQLITYESEFITTTNQSYFYEEVTRTFSHINYKNHYLNFAFNFEVKPILKIPVYFNFGPSLEFLVHSTKNGIDSIYYESSGYDPNTGISYSNSSSNNEIYNDEINGDASSQKLSFYGGLSIEISKNVFISCHLNYHLGTTYNGVKTLDLLLGLGFQIPLPNFSTNKLSLPNFSIYKKKKR